MARWREALDCPGNQVAPVAWGEGGQGVGEKGQQGPDLEHPCASGRIELGQDTSACELPGRAAKPGGDISCGLVENPCLTWGVPKMLGSSILDALI